MKRTICMLATALSLLGCGNKPGYRAENNETQKNEEASGWPANRAVKIVEIVPPEGCLSPKVDIEYYSNWGDSVLKVYCRDQTGKEMLCEYRPEGWSCYTIDKKYFEE